MRPSIFIVSLFAGLLAVGFAEAVERDYSRFCDDGVRESGLISDWSNSKQDGLCLKVRCDYEVEKSERRLCYRQGKHPNTIELHFDDHARAPNLNAYRGKFREVVLVPGEQCFEECRPVESRVLGLFKKEESGLERESCQSCFKQRVERPKEGPYYIAEADTWLYPGMACHHRCKFEKGEFSNERTYTQECQKCAGLNGHEPELFHYVITKNNTCLEVNDGRRAMPVDDLVCETREDIIPTKYSEGSGFTLGVLLLGRDRECFEIDTETYGGLYKREVDKIHCQNEARDNSERHGGKDGGDQSAPASKSTRGSGVTNQ